MRGFFPENIIEDILARTDIAEVISSYIPLKRAGRNLKALCPFHHEKTPSFVVSPERQIYHCFGCGAGGNIFSFLIHYERLTFPEAVQILAKKTGVVLPKFDREDNIKESLNLKVYRINELTIEFYHQLLLNSSEAASSRAYLTRRGITQEIVKKIKLGYAPENWDRLLSYLKSKNISLDLMEKAGLIIPRQEGGYYDRFRKRIIFPIFDLKERIIGFGARVLDESLPKYINSPETPVYIKGRHLYGLNFAKEAIRQNDFVAIVEGYVDFITLYQEGFCNLVASLGTALTIDQIKLLKRYTNNVLMVYDNDQAGELATLRSLDLFIEEEMNVKVVCLPKGFDPDSFVRKFKITVFEDEIKKAGILFDYKLGVLKSRYNLKEVTGKANIVSQILPTVNKFKNAVLKSSYLKRLSEELVVDEEALLIELKKAEDSPRYFYNPEPIKKSRLDIAPHEKMIVTLMLEEQEIILKLSEEISPYEFQDSRISKIVEVMFDLVKQGKSISPNRLINCFSDDEISRIISELSAQDLFIVDKDKALSDCIKRMKQQGLKIKRQKIHDQIKIAHQLGNEEKVYELMHEFQDLTKSSLKKDNTQL